jgi:hypothetical protein
MGTIVTSYSIIRFCLSAYGLIFSGAHFIWAFSLMFLFSGRGYWQELIVLGAQMLCKLLFNRALALHKVVLLVLLTTYRWYCNNLPS